MYAVFPSSNDKPQHELMLSQNSNKDDFGDWASIGEAARARKSSKVKNQIARQLDDLKVPFFHLPSSFLCTRTSSLRHLQHHQRATTILFDHHTRVKWDIKRRGILSVSIQSFKVNCLICEWFGAALLYCLVGTSAPTRRAASVCIAKATLLPRKLIRLQCVLMYRIGCSEVGPIILQS